MIQNQLHGLVNTLALGIIQYEVANHLGNVLTTFTDNKLAVNSGDMVSGYVAQLSSSSDYYPFGSLQPGRSFNAGDYRFGFNGKENDNEVKGTGNSVDFGARIYDSRLGRFMSVDALIEGIPYQSPYIFGGNSPLCFTDFNGYFKIEYSEEALKNAGLTKQDIVRFERIVQNIYNIVQDNPDALKAIINSTGFTEEQIKNDFKSGEGPTIQIVEYGAGARGGASGIVFDINVVKNLEKIDPKDTKKLSEQVLGTALAIIHEYIHYGDQTTNDGKNSGQWISVGSKIVFDAESNDGEKENVKLGKQHWRVTATGHRGTDAEYFGYGVSTYLQKDKTWVIKKEKYIVSSFFPSPPKDLPSDVKDEKILKTLDVK